MLSPRPALLEIGDLFDQFKRAPEQTGRPKTGAVVDTSSQRSTARAHGISKRRASIPQGIRGRMVAIFIDESGNFTPSTPFSAVAALM